MVKAQTLFLKTKSKICIETKREGPVPCPFFTYSEGICINTALRMHKEYRPNDSAEADNVAIIVSRSGVLYEYQFYLLFRAVLIYKLIVPDETTSLHRILDGIITKMREVVLKYELGSDKRDEGATG